MKRETTAALVSVLALVSVGLLAVYSVSAVQGPELFKRELVYVGLGLLCMFLAAYFDYHRFCDPPVFRTLVLVALALLVLVLIPGIGVKSGGAQRWLRLGFVRFQPSEFAKVAVIILLAIKLTANQDQMKSFLRGFMPPTLIAGGFAGLVLLERDLGIPVIIVCVSLVMIFVAGARWRYVLASFLPVVAAGYALILASPYRVRRILAFLDPWSHREDEGFHLIQSLAAFARGSLWGLGPGASEQKLFYLPAAQTDFIFAVWAEEMGLVGTLAVTVLFGILLVTGLRIAMCARDLFGTLLATGIVSLILLQATFNMAVTMGLLPTKGLPLPFISFGGSALVVSLTLVGVLLNVGLQASDPREEPRLVPAH